jgi:trans-aconitate methyltransferase
MDSDERQRLLARAWDEAAEEYDRYFVPRFAPWVSLAVDAVADDLPSGPILVPCCGTFPELPMLAARHPGRAIVGIDLSAGMVDLARRRTEEWPQASVEVGDATALGRRWSRDCAAVVSVFGLQQLPDPEAALADWLATLRPGGILSVVYWPGEVETTGPFALLGQVTARHQAPVDRTWESRLGAVVTAAGASLLRDEDREYPMSHRDAAGFWDAMATGGPLRAFVVAQGDAVVRAVRAEFLDRAPAGPWRHRPRGRWILARR